MPEEPDSPRKALPAVPDKLYYRIGEVARILRVETHTLRFWESEFPQLKVGKGGAGQRLYRRRDVDLLLEIRRLLYDEGYTIPGARHALLSRTRPGKDAVQSPGGPSAEEDSSRRKELTRLRAGLSALRDMLDRPGADAGHGAGTPERSASLRGSHGTATARRRSAPPRAAEQVEAVPGLFDLEDGPPKINPA